MRRLAGGRPAGKPAAPRPPTRGTPSRSCSPRAGSVERAAEAGEELAPLGEVPVAERGRDRLGLRRPGASAQDLEPLAEEGLGVLPIREGLEALVALEVAGGPLPDVAEHLLRPAGARAGGVGARRGGPENELVEVRERRLPCGLPP